ncbi:cysteine peptidase C50 [Pelomyxa schiedti]|nr:cysteine peptidase C50 [Pelomyxa schiedti]
MPEDINNSSVTIDNVVSEEEGEDIEAVLSDGNTTSDGSENSDEVRSSRCTAADQSCLDEAGDDSSDEDNDSSSESCRTDEDNTDDGSQSSQSEDSGRGGSKKDSSEDEEDSDDSGSNSGREASDSARRSTVRIKLAKNKGLSQEISPRSPLASASTRGKTRTLKVTSSTTPHTRKTKKSCDVSFTAPATPTTHNKRLSAAVVDTPQRPRKKTKIQALQETLSAIMSSNHETAFAKHGDTEQERQQWWSRRGEVDQRMKELLKSIENDLLGVWKGLVIAPPLDDCIRSTMEESITKLVRRWANISTNVNSGLVEALFYAKPYLSEEEIKTCISSLLQNQADTCVLQEVNYLCSLYDTALSNAEALQKVKAARSVKSKPMASPASELARQPLILILDKELQALAWESIPVLREHPVSRMPSLPFVTSMAHRVLHRDRTIAHDILRDGITSSRTYYVLDPENNLMNTRATFGPFFSRQRWHGLVGVPPTPTNFKGALESNDLVIYCGHGTGEKYLAGSSIQRLSRCGAVLLMGCSSGHLSYQGECDPTGVPLHYMLAGCPSLVANLWDVTDGDLDKLTKSLLDTWLTDTDGKTSLPCALAKSRTSCRLKYIVGAATVCYGVPVFLAAAPSHDNP